MEKNNYVIKPFIPTRYEYRVDPSDISENRWNIPNGRETGFYRFYGIYLDEGKRIGSLKYYMLNNSSVADLETIEIDPDYIKDRVMEKLF